MNEKDNYQINIIFTEVISKNQLIDDTINKTYYFRKKNLINPYLMEEIGIVITNKTAVFT